MLSGEFLGAGAVVDGNLLRGAHGGVAEMVAFDHVVGVEDAGGLGVRISRWAQEEIQSGEISADGALADSWPVAADGRAVLALAREGDRDAEVLVARAGRVLSIIAGVFGSLFDPRRVILSGMAPADAADLVDAARASLLARARPARSRAGRLAARRRRRLHRSGLARRWTPHAPASSTSGRGGAGLASSDERVASAR